MGEQNHWMVNSRTHHAQLPEPNAGWCAVMCVETSLPLDIFRSFLHQGKKDKRKIRCEHLEVL
jgi:hypothetical protein